MKRSRTTKDEKNQRVPFAPFALTILVDPAGERFVWNMTTFGSLPYQMIYNALENCRNNLVVQEAARKAQAETIERQKANPLLKPALEKVSESIKT